MNWRDEAPFERGEVGRDLLRTACRMGLGRGVSSSDRCETASDITPNAYPIASFQGICSYMRSLSGHFFEEKKREGLCV